MKALIPRDKRIYLVNRDFQFRYMRVAVLVGFASTLLTMFVILYPLFYLKIVRFPAFVPRPFLVGIGIASIINFCAVALLSIHLTHRIAGPVFSLVRQMRLIQSGHWTAYLKVRSSDDMKYLVRNFNELVDYMIATSKRDFMQIDSALTKLKDLDTPGAVKDLQVIRDELASRVKVENENSAQAAAQFNKL